MDQSTKVLVLGPVQIVVGDRHLELGATTRSALLARLAVARGGPVPVARLADEVWGPDAAATDGAVRVTIKRLRDMAGRSAIVHRSGGYALDLDHVELDLVRFERSASMADHGGPEQRRAAAEEALSLVRGTPFSGLGGYPFIGPEVARIEATRDRLVDERLRVLVDLGGGTELVGELEDAWRERPQNEFRCGVLMIALYRAGRQADALAVLRETADRLRDDLGLFPGPQLREIERQVLTQDSALLGPRAPVAPASGAGTDIEAMISSARALARVGAWEPSLRIARQAVADARSQAEPTSICRALLLLAQVGLMSGEHDPHAEPEVHRGALDEATAIARRERDGGLLALAAITRFRCGIGPPGDEQLISVTEPVDHLPRRSVERSNLVSAAAAMAVVSGSGTTAERLLRELERVADDADDPRIDAVRHTTASIVGARRDMTVSEIDERSCHAVSLARSTDDVLLLTAALQARAVALALGGDFEALDRLRTEIDRAGRTGLVPFAIQRARLIGHALALVRGNVDGLVPEIVETMEIGRRIGAAATDAPLAQLTYTLLEQADHRAVIELLPAAGDHDPNGLVEIVRTMARVELDGSAPDTDVQREVDVLVRTLSTVPEGESSPVAVALACELAWWTGSVPLATWALRHLGPTRDRMVVLGLGTLVIGPVELFAGLAHEVLGRPDEAITLLEAALARVESTSAELLAARARLHLAAAYRRRRGPRDAGRAVTLEAAARPDVARLDVLARRVAAG